jgi:DNA-directed RNA polymerase subunit RPC12/RpoP
MKTESKYGEAPDRARTLACPGCGHSDWLSLAEARSLLFGPADVLIMPHAVSITVLRSGGKRLSETGHHLECQNCNHVVLVDEIMPGALVAFRLRP